MKFFLFVFFALSGIVHAAPAEFDLSNVFARGMVLQREARNPVFGRADAGAAVSVSFNGQQKETVADANGNWLIWLDPMPPADQGLELVAQAGARTVKVPGILIGDVWIAAGDYGLAKEMSPAARKLTDGEREPDIRMYLCRMGVSPYPVSRHPMPSMYIRADQDGMKKFSSILYAFARTIRKAEKVPVGFFNSSGRFSLTGAMPAQSAPYLKHPGNQDLAAAMRKTLPGEEDGKAAYTAYARAMRAWINDARERVRAGRHPDLAPEIPNAGLVFGGDFNARIHPVRLFPVKGVIWYYHDRESYPGGAPQAFDRYRALIQGWREVLGNPDLPFYFVQHHHPGGVEKNPAKQSDLPLVQSELLNIPRTGVAVTYDLADRKGWDLPHRFEAGQRLALWAIRDVYGRNVEPQGPTCAGIMVQGNQALVRFNHAGGGLTAAQKSDLSAPVPVADASVHGFALAGPDGRWKWANAKIVSGDQVQVWSDEVSEPVEVAYAVNNSPEAPNLYSRSGLPALPFKKGRVAP